MQELSNGRDLVHQSFSVFNPKTNEQYQLFELKSGAFQWGTGRDAKIVSSVDEVLVFGPHISARVEAWLKRNGPKLAYQEKVRQDIQEQSGSLPGSLDSRVAMLEQMNPGLKADIQALLDAKLVQAGLVPDPSSMGLTSTPAPNPRLKQLSREERALLAKRGIQFAPGTEPRSFDPDSIDFDSDGPELSADMDRAGAMQRLKEEMSALDEDGAAVLGA